MPSELTVIALYPHVDDLPTAVAELVPHVGDSWTSRELVNILESIRSTAPGLSLRALVSGHGDDWFDRHVFRVSTEGVDVEPAQLSLSADEPQPALFPRDAAPEKRLHLDVPAAPFVAEI